MYGTSANISHDFENYLAADPYLRIGFQAVLVSRAI